MNNSSGFTGVNCETEIDECETNSCPEYSTCVDKINHHRCICKNREFLVLTIAVSVKNHEILVLTIAVSAKIVRFKS